MDVTERIEVTFNEARRGIFRYIPVQYDAGHGFNRGIFLKGIGVFDESGARQTTQVKKDAMNVFIRIGDADIYLPPGTRKTYVITYTVYGMLNWFDKDAVWDPWVELYWNITGDQWDAPMRRVSFEVEFPSVKDAKTVRTRLFYGPFGSTQQQNVAGKANDSYGQETEYTVSQSENRVSGERLTESPPMRGTTLVLSLPAETIPKPTLLQNLWLILMANLGLLNPIIVLLVLFWLWMMYGRDPAGGPMVVQFEAPDGLGAAECGAMTDERVDQRDIAAAIISIAQKGFLRIQVVATGFIFSSTSVTMEVISDGDPAHLTTFEAELYWRLKKCGPLITEYDLKTEIAPYIAEVRNTLYDDLVTRGLYHSNPNAVRQIWISIGILLAIGLAFVLNVAGYSFSPIPAIVGGVISAIIVVLFGAQMPRRTVLGSRVRQRVIGFEEFIRRAQKNELDWMSKRHPDQALFEEYLPYAIAFGLGKEWASVFRNVDIVPPGWYSSPYPDRFSTFYFIDSLNSAMMSVTRAASTPPARSSSSGGSGGSSGFSSGGGFSGGGFGGGGGGSW